MTTHRFTEIELSLIGVSLRIAAERYERIQALLLAELFESADDGFLEMYDDPYDDESDGALEFPEGSGG